MEYALNDFQDAGWSLGNWDNHSRRAIERLLRKLLQFPKRPAVIMLGSFPHLIRDIGCVESIRERKEKRMAVCLQQLTLAGQ